MPKLTTLPQPTTVTLWPLDHKPSPQLAAAIRAGIRQLDALGADQHADYWCQELHRVDGYPIEHRWTDGTLALIERDVMQAELQTGQTA
jgi:hypothetical protein